MRTRREHSKLVRTAEKNFENLKYEVLSPEVAEIAGNLYGILSAISSTYTCEAIVDLIPELTTVLNRLDASFKVIDDMKGNIEDLYNENNYLAKSLEKEKKTRKINLDDSLQYEEKAEEEIKELKDIIETLKTCNENLKEEIKNKNTIIDMLHEDYNRVATRVDTTIDKCSTYPKKCSKPKNMPVSSPIEVQNRFSTLSMDSPMSTQGEPTYVTTTAQIHEEPKIVGYNKHPKMVKSIRDIPGSNTKRNKVTILCDSMGKELHKYLRELENDFDIFVYCAPGAKLKNVMDGGLAFVNCFTEQDFVIILAGTNDLSRNEPAQLTIKQGIRKLISLNIKTNIILNHIPDRYDKPSLNDNVYVCNKLISKMVRNYKGPLNIVCDDTISSVMRRSHFTRHGLHFSRQGKRHLGDHLCTMVRGFGSLSGATRRPRSVDGALAESRRRGTSTSPSLDTIEVLPSTESPCAAGRRQPSPPSLTQYTAYHHHLPDGLLDVQSCLDFSTSSEPGGQEDVANSFVEPRVFLDLHSWPTLVR